MSQFEAQPVEAVESKVTRVTAREIYLADGSRGVRVRQEPGGKVYIGINRVGKNESDAFITPEQFFDAIGKLVRWANEKPSAKRKASRKGVR